MRIVKVFKEIFNLIPLFLMLWMLIWVMFFMVGCCNLEKYELYPIYELKPSIMGGYEIEEKVAFWDIRKK